MPMMKSNDNKPKEETSVRPHHRGVREKKSLRDDMKECACMKDGWDSWKKIIHTEKRTYKGQNSAYKQLRPDKKERPYSKSRSVNTCDAI